jgi:fatty acid desaturase
MTENKQPAESIAFGKARWLERTALASAAVYFLVYAALAISWHTAAKRLPLDIMVSVCALLLAAGALVFAVISISLGASQMEQVEERREDDRALANAMIDLTKELRRHREIPPVDNSPAVRDAGKP